MCSPCGPAGPGRPEVHRAWARARAAAAASRAFAAAPGGPDSERLLEHLLELPGCQGLLGVVVPADVCPLDEDGRDRALARHLGQLGLDRVAVVSLVELDDRRVDLGASKRVRELGWLAQRTSRFLKTFFVLSQNGHHDLEKTYRRPVRAAATRAARGAREGRTTTSADDTEPAMSKDMVVDMRRKDAAAGRNLGGSHTRRSGCLSVCGPETHDAGLITRPRTS